MPESHPRIVAAAQAKVDFYEPLRGRQSEWTETDYAEAEMAVKAADAWDAANGIHRVTVDDSLRDRLMDALHSGDLYEDADTVLAAVLNVIAPAGQPAQQGPEAGS